MTDKEKEDDRIQSPFRPKDWNEIRIKYLICENVGEELLCGVEVAVVEIL